MASNRKIAAIVNPQSAGGWTGRHWHSIAAKLERRLGPFASHFTGAAGAGIALARQLVDEGFDFLIAVGGDGTANEIANGILESGEGGRNVILGLIPTGTGGDFRRSLGIPVNVDEAVQVLVSGVSVAIDVGKVDYRDLRGQAATRHFINLVSFGMGGEVASRKKNALGFLGGRAAFFWATLASLAGYNGRRVTLHLNGAHRSFTITNVAVGNGRYHGGGMHPCPAAILDDGMLEVTVIDRLSAFELLRDIHYLYSENVYRHPKTHHFRAIELSAESKEVTKIEVDGEPLGTLPVGITLAPHRLNIITAAEGASVAGFPTPPPGGSPWK